MSDLHTDTDRGHRPLAGVVMAFDLDNTLLDPAGTAYGQTNDEFLSMIDLGRNLDDGRKAYEILRSWGPGLERIGLANPIHRRGHPEAVAVLHLIFGPIIASLVDLDRDCLDKRAFLEVIEETIHLDSATRTGTSEEQIKAEIAIRRFLQQNKQVDRIRSAVRRAAKLPQIGAWSEAHRSIERRLVRGVSGAFLIALAAKGAVPIVVTKGHRDVQFDKLDQLGVLSLLTGRVLTTEAASDFPGRGSFDARVDQLIDAAVRSPGEQPGDELSFLWPFRRVIHEWSSKTPSFYGRCLHAIQQSPHDPESALARPAFVPAAAWRKRPLRFVMVGDRYDTDVEPLIDLLGPDAGMTIRLRMGKYALNDLESKLSVDRRPTHSFTNWESLSEFLTEELTVEQVRPILDPPPMVDESSLAEAEIERGLGHELEAVRLVARIARRDPQSSSEIPRIT